MYSYTVLAKYYDKLMGDFDYKGYVAFIKDLLQGQGVDLCCGSGKITMALARLGKKMIGVDLSADMLNFAIQNSKKNSLDILYVQEDILQFEPAHKLDFACCVCDGINYIPTQELPKLWNNISNFLKDDGVFVFDISTAYKLEKVLGDNMFCEDYDDLTYIWSNSFDPEEKTLDMQISFFEKKHHNDYLRIDECHLQYAHSTQFVIDSLQQYFDVQVYDGESYGAIKKNSKRALFVCRKK